MRDVVCGKLEIGRIIVGLGLTRGAGLPEFNEGYVFPLLESLRHVIDDHLSNRLIQVVANIRTDFQ